MNTGEIFSCIILAALLWATLILCGTQDMTATAINDRLDALEDNMVARTVPRITIEGRAAVYAGTGEIVVEDLGHKRGGGEMAKEEIETKMRISDDI